MLKSFIRKGQLTVIDAEGKRHVFGGREPGPQVTMRLTDPKLYRSLVFKAELAAGEAYMDGTMRFEEGSTLRDFLRLFSVNRLSLGSYPVQKVLRAIKMRFRKSMQSNRKGEAQLYVAHHYELGNDFYKLWLDRTMTYSSALFDAHTQSLAEAQEAKYARIVRELEIGPNDHVLEIGCGWGGFAEYAIRTTGCRVTGLTLSVEQAKFARDRLERAGLSQNVDIRLEDYRHCEGQFDKIVSIEMFEAVGEENWPVYFKTVRERLKPGGSAMVQSITIHDDRFHSYRRNADFIQTYIFPGGMLPSVEMFNAGARKAGLELGHMLAFGRDYDRTLIAWDHAFVANWPAIEKLGFDRKFHRLWRFYLHYCAVGFRTGRIDVVQFRLNRPH